MKVAPSKVHELPLGSSWNTASRTWRHRVGRLTDQNLFPAQLAAQAAKLGIGKRSLQPSCAASCTLRKSCCNPAFNSRPFLQSCWTELMLKVADFLAFKAIVLTHDIPCKLRHLCSCACFFAPESLSLSSTNQMEPLWVRRRA